MSPYTFKYCLSYTIAFALQNDAFSNDTFTVFQSCSDAWDAPAACDFEQILNGC